MKILLLHGYKNTKFATRHIETALQNVGFEVYNQQYNWHKSIGEISEELLQNFKNKKIDAIVGYSMGGIIGKILADNMEVKKLLMIASPANGSEIAQLIKKFPMSDLIFGKALLEIDRPISNPIRKYNVGMISGSRSNKVIGWLFFKSKLNDGKTSVESTNIEWADDFILMDESHCSLLFSEKTHSQIVHFLKYSSFIK